MKTFPLWKVVVGSHLWMMEHPGSDTDYFSAYVVDTRSILRGEVQGGGAHFSQTEGVDEQRHEVGKWIDMLLRGNCNYIWGIFSPIVVSAKESVAYLGGTPAEMEGTGRSWLEELREITRRGMAKNIARSIKGLAIGNIKKYQGQGADEIRMVKVFKGVGRSLRFGIRWMNGEGPHFEPYTGPATEEAVMGLVADFDAATAASVLPERPQNEGEFRDFLERVRMAFL